MEVKERLDHIDKSSGLAIISVVFGHILFPETRQINWYIQTAYFIYKFHMPLFMCISGYLAFLSIANKDLSNENAYLSFQKKKVRKFLPAYIFFSGLAILIDIFYRHATIKVINKAVFSFFFTPTVGSAVFVWYLYVLMGFYLITPFLTNIRNQSLYILLAFAFLLTNVKFTPVFCFDFFCKFFFFFLLGGLIYKNNRKFADFLKRNGKWIILLAIPLTVIDFLTDLSIPYQVICILFIPAVFYISQLKWPAIISRVFIKVGVSSFGIYLLNTTLLNVYYYIYKNYIKAEIGTFFIFSSLLVTILLAIAIRTVFNIVVPKKVYVL